MRIPVVVIGAGHGGLAVSRRLTERSIDHVVLERGDVANAWRTERWDSLRLLTPNWLADLPGQPYDGDDPNGYMPAAELATRLAAYAAAGGAPVRTRTTVTSVRGASGGFAVTTDRGCWYATALVLATGPGSAPRRPAAATGLPAGIAVVPAAAYRSPEGLAPGGVLVVGASASGVQLAAELRRTGRPVTLAVGEHVRMPRRYRGRDVFWWTDATGVLDERDDEVPDLARARRLPSPQLVGDGRDVDLRRLREAGVVITGRLARCADGRAQFSGGLANTCALADLKLARLLDRFDAWADRTGADVGPPERFPPTPVGPPVLDLDLRRAGITTVLLATGARPDLSWLDLPVLDRRGDVVHDGGACRDAPGCFVVGLPLLRSRRSSYVCGAAADSAAIAAGVHAHLDRTAARTP